MPGPSDCSVFGIVDLRPTPREISIMDIYTRKIRAICWVLIGVLMSQGCSKYHAVDMEAASGLVEEINEKGETRRSKIYTLDGQKYSASNLHVGPDSSFWYTAGDTIPMGRPTAEIEKIVYIDRSMGAGDGFFLGAIPLFAVAVMYDISYSTQTAGCSGGHMFCIAPGAISAAGLVTAIVAGLVTASVGWLVGHEDVYGISDSTLPREDLLKRWGFKAGRTGATQVWEGSWPSSWFNGSELYEEPGVHIGCFAEWRVLRNISISTGLNFEEKGFSHYSRYEKVYTHSRFLYLSLPVTVKYSVPLRYVTPYLLGGPRIDYFLGSPEDPWGVASSFDDFNFGLSFGGGIELWSDDSGAVFVEFVYNYDLDHICETESFYPGTTTTITNKSYNISLGIGF